ncbi:MAG: hypothetical protein A3K19_12980 [Lentisphaerae bacterium RIFOXYB12_FULL_65_16]|nr:MAG: hypothetical protein A3K18_04725 [Lentisphaerae bacterium RIFOXYA12_64_32]OGV87225.1 MAG: hypothetical protein A3K19_12980 [Lentisphaerae bacterium RIFOXYB12_FULL_65_16]
MVSVVIPCYNAAAFIGEAVGSALMQTMRDLEVIVVDDGSTDDTADIVRGIDDARVQYIFQENASQAMARNAGIGVARGEFVAFLDADDRWYPEKLAKQMPLFTTPDVGLVCCQFDIADPEGTVVTRGRQRLHRGRVLAQLLLDNFVCCSSVVVRSSLLHGEHRFRAGRKGVEDWDLWLRLAMRSQFDFVEEALLGYRAHPGSVSRNLDLIVEGVRVTATATERDIRSRCAPSEQAGLLRNLHRALARENMAYAHWLLRESRNADAAGACKAALRVARPTLGILRDAAKFAVKAGVWGILGRPGHGNGR